MCCTQACLAWLSLHPDKHKHKDRQVRKNISLMVRISPIIISDGILLLPWQDQRCTCRWDQDIWSTVSANSCAIASAIRINCICICIFTCICILICTCRVDIWTAASPNSCVRAIMINCHVCHHTYAKSYFYRVHIVARTQWHRYSCISASHLRFCGFEQFIFWSITKCVVWRSKHTENELYFWGFWA